MNDTTVPEINVKLAANPGCLFLVGGAMMKVGDWDLCEPAGVDLAWPYFSIMATCPGPEHECWLISLRVWPGPESMASLDRPSALLPV